MRTVRIFFSFISIVLPLLLSSCGKLGSGSADKDKNSAGETIIETGTLEAINNKLFSVPPSRYYSYQMRIISILEHGAKVEEGDLVIQMDPSDINKNIISRETDLETQIANLEKMEVEQNNHIRELESKIKNETATFDLKKIELEASSFETERKQAIKQLEFKQAEITLAKEKRMFELTKIIIKNDKIIQNIRVRQIQDEIVSLQNVLPLLTIHTSVAGVFQRAINVFNGTLLNVGDMAYLPYPLGNVPELKWMRVNSFINENDFRKIKVGQKVVVRLDALPEVKFNGEVSYLGKLCRRKEQNSRQKGFDVEVKILDSDERLKPGMTVSCEFLSN